MRDCRDVIMLAKPGYIYVVEKMEREDRRREERGGDKGAGRKWREESGGKKEERWEERGGKKEARLDILIYYLYF